MEVIDSMYVKYYKRCIDFMISLCAVIALAPIILILTILGMIFMDRTPFFIQERSGKNERHFNLIKFRTMSNQKDKEGNLLPDEIRLTKYGKLLRASSLDELPEVINILKGDMSIIGPRPLLPKDVSYMNKEQQRRHSVRPGLTGLAQCEGRNSLNWDRKLETDIEYIENLTFFMDCKIFFKTIYKVLKREGITFEEGTDMDLKDWNESKKKRAEEK